MLFGQKTPGYIPVDTGYLPVSNAALWLTTKTVNYTIRNIISLKFAEL